MSHWRTWLAAGVVVLVLAGGIAGWELGRDASRAKVEARARPAAALGAAPGEMPSAASPAEPAGAADPYHASDPALLAATGRPQLVEFYHRL